MSSSIARSVAATTLALGLTLGLPLGCARSDASPPPPPLVGDARAVDRLVGLWQAQLAATTDSAIIADQQAIVCEQTRVLDALGTTNGVERIAAAHDTVFILPTSPAQLRVQYVLRNRDFSSAGCPLKT
jgi:hypothetical protein